MIELFTLVQNRIKNALSNKCALVHFLDKTQETSPENGYKKTSLSLKHKEEVIISQGIKDAYQEYCGRIKSDEILRLIPKGTKPRMFQEWMVEKGFKAD